MALVSSYSNSDIHSKKRCFLSTERCRVGRFLRFRARKPPINPGRHTTREIRPRKIRVKPHGEPTRRGRPTTVPGKSKSVSDVLRRSGRRTTVPVRCTSFRLVQGRRTRFRVSFTFCGVKERQRTNLNLLQVGDFPLSPRRARKQRDWHRRLVSVKNTSRIHWWRKKPDRQHVHRTHRGRRTRAQRGRKRGRPHPRFSNQRSIEKPLYRGFSIFAVFIPKTCWTSGARSPEVLNRDGTRTANRKRTSEANSDSWVSYRGTVARIIPR
nr:uncharacterized protein LOC115254146 [Aedes albopictus]